MALGSDPTPEPEIPRANTRREEKEGNHHHRSAETVAKVRSCVVMLDLELDDLIREMFKHFFTTM
jgi:hypothetical protein